MIYYILYPLVMFTFAFGVIHFLVKRPKKKLYLIFGIILYITCLPFIPRALIFTLESKYPPININDLLNKKYHILVLGAGKNDDTRLQFQQRLSPLALMRLIEGVRLCLQLSETQLITSGPKGKGDKSQAQLMKETAIALGVQQECISVQENVTNTETEAAAYLAAFGTDTPLIVCTSAIHMPRAVAWFEANGVKQIIAAPTDYLAPKSIAFQWRSLLPSLKNLDLWKLWGKEVLGKRLIGLYKNTQ